MIKIKATFIGKNGSMGFYTNKEYNLTIHNCKGYFTIFNDDGKGYCQYNSIISFLDNWKNINQA